MAGKATRAAAHKKKMAVKRAAKTARRALYASMRGTTKKNKKINKKKTGEALFNTWSGKKHRHLMRFCGNTGCATCFRIWPPKGTPGSKLEQRPDLFTRKWGDAA